MAQSIVQKQQTFVANYSNAVVGLINAVNALADLKSEWDAQGYATGAPSIQGTNYNLTDAVVQAALPASTAPQVNLAVGAVEAIRATVAANTGYLYPLKP